MRNTKRYPVEGTNLLLQIYKTDIFFKVMNNFIIIVIGRCMSFLSVNNWLYRTFLKVNVSRKKAFALMVMTDTMFQEKISIADNTIIGYNTTILAHEYLINEYRIGEVKIDNNVLIGANTTI